METSISTVVDVGIIHIGRGQLDAFRTAHFYFIIFFSSGQPYDFKSFRIVSAIGVRTCVAYKAIATPEIFFF
jgi:hypothetical protein